MAMKKMWMGTLKWAKNTIKLKKRRQSMVF